MSPSESWIYNATIEMSNYMINTQGSAAAGRPMYDAGLYFGPEGTPIVMVNSSDVHSGPIGLNILSNLFLKRAAEATSGASVAATSSITVSNHPFGLTQWQKDESAQIFSLLASLIYTIAFCFIPASWAAFVVKERETKAMHQQLVSGVSVHAYWLGNWIWDQINLGP